MSRMKLYLRPTVNLLRPERARSEGCTGTKSYRERGLSLQFSFCVALHARLDLIQGRRLSNFMVQDLGFRALGSGCGVEDLIGFRV